MKEGGTVRFTATASDPNIPAENLTYQLDPGGAAGATINPTTGAFSWTAPTPGSYSIGVHVTNSGTPPFSDDKSFTVTVTDVAPTVTAGGNVTLLEASTLTQSGSFSEPGTDPWTATVNYGDGSGTINLPLSGKTFSLSHKYTAPGQFLVTVSVNDHNGGIGTASFSVTSRTRPTADFLGNGHSDIAVYLPDQNTFMIDLMNGAG